MRESKEEFWTRAYHRNLGKMIGICYRYTSNLHLSEDLVHDAFIKAIDKFDTFKGKGHFDAWLRRIVVNHVLQYIRNQKKQPYVDEGTPLDHDFQSELIYSENQSINRYAFSEDELLWAIEQLPEHHKLVFNLYVIDKFTHAQIGKKLGISSGTSKSHLSRARKKLKCLLTQKADIEQKKRERKKILPWFFFLFGSREIDILYQKRLHSFEIPSNKDLWLDSVQLKAIPQTSFNSWNTIFWPLSLLGFSVVGISMALFFSLNPWHKNLFNTPSTVSVSGADKDLQIAKIEEFGGASKAKGDSTEESTLADSSTATISKNTVILDEYSNTINMTSLDSLTVALLASASMLMDSATHPEFQPTISGISQKEVKMVEEPLTNKIETLTNNILSDESEPAKIHKKKSGRFYASKLFWSSRNKALYFKGKVKVNFSENSFSGRGTHDFLGPVHLFIFNAKPAEFDTNIKLSSQAYSLVKLESEEAFRKYGEKGRRGAIEIAVIE